MNTNGSDRVDLSVGGLYIDDGSTLRAATAADVAAVPTDDTPAPVDADVAADPAAGV